MNIVKVYILMDNESNFIKVLSDKEEAEAIAETDGYHLRETEIKVTL